MGRQTFGTRMVHRETFLQTQLRPLQHVIRRRKAVPFVQSGKEWKLLNNTSRNLLSRTGPSTRMTLSTMTTPSAWRSLHHCSHRSEKMIRVVDELITLKTKVCRPVSRRPSVMIERWDPLWNRLIHKLQMFEKFRVTAQKASKSGFLWNDKESRFSLTFKQIFESTNSRPIMTEEVFKS